MAGPVVQVGEHVRVATRQMAGAMQPAQVTPYCGRCNVAWPCPSAAAGGASAEPPAPSGQPELVRGTSGALVVGDLVRGRVGSNSVAF